jgi:hypothetical protein
MYDLIRPVSTGTATDQRPPFTRMTKAFFMIFLWLLILLPGSGRASDSDAEGELLARIDAPLLYLKRHSYKGIHIYDTFYKWPPGGGGIFIVENTHEARSEWKERCIIGEDTSHIPGKGVYTHPEISWDAKKLLFCYKDTPGGNTCIYEIGIDGRGLRKVSDPAETGAHFNGTKNRSGMHDISPSYLPDGRIVFLSTRAAGLVPCNNSGVTLLHVMNADGSDIHPISVNSENEFDPNILPDGRIIFGRWEYIDKNALTVQSLWTIHPDGSNETAMFANNMTFPEACLDPRPVPGTGLIAITQAKHNGTPRGTVSYIDPAQGKNTPKAITNFSTPDKPTHDIGNSCEPYPLDTDTLICSGRAAGDPRNVIEMMHRNGQRLTLLSDPDICLHAPMLVKARKKPPVLPQLTDRSMKKGTFFVQNVYEGLAGVKHGEAKWLRVVEESSRVSESPLSRNPYNQTFLVSGALAFATKIYHGMVPINDDGSIYFEAPSGRLLYFQVLDKDKRLIQSMRTFIQAAPGTVRSCIGCHEDKSNTPVLRARGSATLQGMPSKPKAESWGNGYMDYPSMIQPIWDRHCVECHGGEQGFAGRLDLTGGWTTNFNISYENLIDRRETQLIAHYISGIDSMNGTAHYSNQLFPPRSHGSATAPLAKVIMNGHEDVKLDEKERDLVMAWIDSNGIYYGNWDYTEHGYTSQAVDETYTRLGKVMEEAKCTQCHDGKITRDWVNLQRPELSRILRAPLSKAGAGLGGEICRDHPMDPRRKRITLLRSGRYEHAVKALSFFPSEPVPAPQAGGRTAPSFASPADPLYQKMLAIIETGRTKTLSEPRADMPGALVIAGEDRIMIEPDLPARAPELSAEYGTASQLHLTWPRTPDNIGLRAEVHRSYQADFRPGPETLVAETLTDHFIDQEPRAATPHYALVLKNRDGARSAPSHVDARNVHPELLVAGSDAGAIRIRNGKVTQVYETPGICMDAWQLRDGSVVATGRSGLRKYDPHGKLVFEYRAANEKSEIYAGMPLPDGGTLVSESAPARLIELDRDGTPRKVVPVTDIALDHPHKQMRGARKNAKGEYVIVSSYEKRLIVLNADGSRKKIIDLGTLPAPLTPKLLHSVVPLDNDHLLVGTSYDGSFVMLDENERVIWSLSPQDLPELGIKYASGMHRLPNGNLICTAYNSAYPVFEITPDKEIVWKLKADHAFGKPLNVQAVYLSGNAENFELRK